MNTILAAQNEQQQLDRLAAQRQLYADAKCILAIQMVCSVFVSVALALWVLSDPRHSQLRVWAAAWGVGFTFADLFCLSPWQKTLKKKASTIQEMFDCHVLQLRWKRGRDTIEADDVAQLARRHEKGIGREKFLKNFSGWYEGALDTVPLETVRIICQKSNFRWDVGLRQRYMNAVTGLLVLILIGVFIYGTTQNLPMQEWFAGVLLPLQPLIVLCVRQIQENREAIGTLNRLKRDTEKLWNEALEGSDSQSLTEKSRDLQDELFDQRAKNPLIFDWIYKILKRRSEEEMNIGTDALIEQAGKAHHE